MTGVVSRALPPPSNWQDFEAVCFDLFSRLWKTNDAEMHGRRGQPQGGVDVYGTDRVEGAFVGVQCKGKDADYGGHLTEAELLSEVAKAKSFSPALDVFILATTATNDASIQQVARALTTEHRKLGLFEVRVQGWNTLKQRITDYPDLLRKYFQDFAPFDLIAKADETLEATLRSRDTILQAQLENTTRIIEAFHLERGEANDPLKDKIDFAVQLIEDGNLKAALGAFERLWDEDGERASARNRYRLLANIGNVHLHLGHPADAVKFFRDAHAADPSWPRAQAMLATAQLVEGDREGAYETAQKVLAADPEAEQAASVLIDAAPAEMTVEAVEAALPPAMRNCFGVLLGLSIRARNARDFAAAERFARAALKDRERDWRPLSLTAEALFAPIGEVEALGFTRQLPPDAQPAFNEALQLERSAWTILAAREDTIRGEHVAANLLAMLDLAGLDEEAALVLDQALRVAPTYPPLLRRYAQKMADNNDWPSVAKALDAIPDDEREGGDVLLRLQTFVELGQWSEALAKADALIASSEDDRLLQLVGAISLSAAAQLGRLEEKLDQFLSRWPSSIVVRSAAVRALPPDTERSAALAREIQELASAITDPRDRFQAGEALYRAKMFSQAADLFDTLHGTDRDHPALMRHLRSLYFADRRAEARALFDGLAADVKATPAYAEMGAAIYERAGLLPQTRELLELCLAREEDLETRLHWITVLDRSGAQGDLKAWLDTVPVHQDGRPGDLMRLALAIDHYLGDVRSLPIAYRALRAGYGDPQIHLGYTVGLFLMGKVGREIIDVPTEVAVDTAVVLENTRDGRRLVRILETEPDPRIERDEIAMSNALVPAILGKQVGDKIELESIGPDNVHYKIIEIYSKYVFAHLRSLQNFSTMFPENKALGQFDIGNENSEGRFEPIFNAVKRRHEFSETLMEAYRSRAFPIGVVAELSGTSPMETWEVLRNRPDVGLQVVAGSAEEFSAAHEVLRSCRTAVVEPATLYGIAKLGLQEAVRAAFDDVAIVQTSLDLLREHRDEYRAKRGQPQMSLGWDGQNFIRSEPSSEAVEAAVADAERAVLFAESLTVLPAEASREVSSEAREAFERMHRSFLDTTIAAQCDGRVLLSDDHATRLLARAVDVKSVWTQAACAYAAEQGSLAATELHDVTAALAVARYVFTKVGHQDLLGALSRERPGETIRLDRLIELLALPTNDRVSVRMVLANLYLDAWRQLGGDAYEAFFVRVFSAFVRSFGFGDAQDQAAEGLAAIAPRLQGLARSRYLKAQLNAHTHLTPFEWVISRAEKPALDLTHRMADRLNAALAAAAGARAQG